MFAPDLFREGTSFSLLKNWSINKQSNSTRNDHQANVHIKKSNRGMALLLATKKTRNMHEHQLLLRMDPNALAHESLHIYTDTVFLRLYLNFNKTSRECIILRCAKKEARCVYSVHGCIVPGPEDFLEA